MKSRIFFMVVIALVFFQTSAIKAQVSFPSFISDNMVLQRETEVPIWGKAKSNSKINITCSWDNKKYATTAKEDGKWMLKIKTPIAGGPFTIQVNDLLLKNILIGEVWICSGQSNMQASLGQFKQDTSDIINANIPDIRLFYVARELADAPKENCYGVWEKCTSRTAKSFSAVAYYFGKKLYEELHVPIGLIHTSWGGSTAQAWVNEDLIKNDTSYIPFFEKEIQKAKIAKPGELPITQHSPAKLYNGMIHPLLSYGIKGVIWYQGESNVDYCSGDPERYLKLFPLLIKSWRNEWKQGDFPFYYVQIAPFRYPAIKGALVRDAQRKCLAVKNTGMAVTLDIGDTTDIHPKNKLDVGNRLALWALAKNYGKSDLVYSGPIYKSLSIKENKAIVNFLEIGSGLVAKDGNLTEFEIAGEDKVFYEAEALVEGNTILVSTDKVKKPVAVRYAFRNNSVASLFNREGLPASSFRTDDWPADIRPVVK